jgi:glycosyltransferase involved in cell wall biosynthesis
MEILQKKILKKGVTVLICTYNGAKNLPATLLNLSCQKIAPNIEWEVLLVDNASTDNSAKIAGEIWSRYGSPIPLKILRENKPGKDNAIDLGFSTAQYSYVIICDDDNWLKEDYVQLGYSIMNANPQIGMLGGKGIPVFEEDCAVPYWFNSFQKFYAVGPQNFLNGEIEHYWPAYRFLWGAGAVINLEAYRVLQDCGFKRILAYEKYPKVARSEDVELSLAIWLSGYKLWYDERLVFQHFISKEKLKISCFLKIVKQSISAIHYLRPYQILIFTGTEDAPSKSFWWQYIVHHLRFLLGQFKSISNFVDLARVIGNRHLEDVNYVNKAIEWYKVKSVIGLGKGYHHLFKRVLKLQKRLSAANNIRHKTENISKDLYEANRVAFG